MDLFLVQVDGLEVSVTDSEVAAAEHARKLAGDDLASSVVVLRVRDGSLDIIPRIPAAEAAIA